jgi:hypothetical protein
MGKRIGIEIVPHRLVIIPELAIHPVHPVSKFADPRSLHLHGYGLDQRLATHSFRDWPRCGVQTAPADEKGPREGGRNERFGKRNAVGGTSSVAKALAGRADGGGRDRQHNIRDARFAGCRAPE